MRMVGSIDWCLDLCGSLLFEGIMSLLYFLPKLILGPPLCFLLALMRFEKVQASWSDSSGGNLLLNRSTF